MIRVQNVCGGHLQEGWLDVLIAAVEMVTLDIIHYLLRLPQLPSQSPLPSRHHLEININVVRNNPVRPLFKISIPCDRAAK